MDEKGVGGREHNGSVEDWIKNMKTNDAKS
jgi:hypothetical protein